MNCTIGITEDSNSPINYHIMDIVTRAQANEFEYGVELVWDFSNQDFSYRIFFTITNDFNDKSYNELLQFKSKLDYGINSKLVIQDDGYDCEATGGTTFILSDGIFKISVTSYDGSDICKATDSFFSIRYSKSVISAFENMLRIIEALRFGKINSQVRTMNMSN